MGSVEGRQLTRRQGPVWTRRRLIAGAGLGVVALAARPIAGRASETTVTSPGPEPVWVNGRRYDAYIPAASKPTQYFYYTCEFDSAWVIFQTFGMDVGFEEQLAIVGYNRDPEPYWTDTADGVVIMGGDIGATFCGDYTSNLVAKIRGSAMKQIFDAYDVPSKAVKQREDIEACLLAGGLALMKCTVDFKEYIPAVWVATNGKRYPVPFTNDHAVVVLGYNAEVVVIRDVLGPTDTNWDRQYEYEVPWDVFIASVESHEWDGRAVYPPGTLELPSTIRHVTSESAEAPETDGTGGETPAA